MITLGLLLNSRGQGGTPGSCLALYFASTPSVNERSTLTSPFCKWSGTFAHCSWWCWLRGWA